MSYFQVERLPDALRTIRRLAVCVVPIFVVVFALTPNRFSHSSSVMLEDMPAMLKDMIRFEQELILGMTLPFFLFLGSVFASWQANARSPFTDEGSLGWLSIHGWDGEPQKLPQRGLLPISEFLGMVVVSLICWLRTPNSAVFLLMGWSVTRLLYCSKFIFREQPITVGIVFLLQATTVLFSRTPWISIPIELTAIAISEYLIADALCRTAKEMQNNDVTLITKLSLFAPANRSRQLKKTANLVAQRLFPFSQLGIVAGGKRPSWKMSIWVAVVCAWLIFCITTQYLELDKFMSDASHPPTGHGLIGIVGMTVVVVIGLIRMLMQFEPLVWQSRLGLWTRLWMLRPIVWSWDRILWPHLLNAAIVGLTAKFVVYASPVSFAVLLFVEVIVLLRCGVTHEEWQMTSDVRIMPTYLMSGLVDNRPD